MLIDMGDFKIPVQTMTLLRLSEMLGGYNDKRIIMAGLYTLNILYYLGTRPQ